MKKRIRIYYIVLAILCLVSTIIFLCKNVSGYNDYKYEINECNKYLGLEVKQSNYDTNDYDIERCKYILNDNEKPYSFFLAFEQFIETGIFKFIFPFFVSIIIFIPLVYKLSLELDSNYIKYYLLRKKYKSYVFDLIKKAYKNIFVILLMLSLLIIVSLIKSSFNISPRLDIYLFYLSQEALLFENPINCVIYVVIIILNLLIYANIALMVLRNNHKNYLISLTECFLVTYMYLCFTFIVIGVFVDKYFGIISEQINLFEIFTWHVITNPILFLIVNTIYYIISLVIVLLMYKNKEKIIMKCEG